MEAPASVPGTDEDDILCRPCRKKFPVASLANPKRCPQCGGPTFTAAQSESMKAATARALIDLRRESVRLMRLTSFSMMSIQIITYFFQDREAADFFEHVVTIASVAASIATEVWARTASRGSMIVASIFIQAASILFFFAATAFFSMFLPSRLAVFLACLPLAGSLMAWHHFRGYNKILRRS